MRLVALRWMVVDPGQMDLLDRTGATRKNLHPEETNHQKQNTKSRCMSELRPHMENLKGVKSWI